jgi:hypothetical protein
MVWQYFPDCQDLKNKDPMRSEDRHFRKIYPESTNSNNEYYIEAIDKEIKKEVSSNGRSIVVSKYNTIRLF